MEGKHIRNLHEAQAYEDARQSMLEIERSLHLPLESRREETQQETWDDAVSLEEVEQASRTLAFHSMNEDGSASCLAIDSKLIFAGLSSSKILLFDHFGVTRNVLEAPLEAGSVTSLDSYQNNLLLAGYEDGRIILWDASNAQRLLDVSGPTGSPITVIRWYRPGQSCVSIDASGVAYLFKFTKTFLLNTFAADKKLLLDGRARQGFGPIFASEVLTSESSVGLALAVASFTLIVRLEPEPTKIASRWELRGFSPEVSGQTGDHSSIPCLAYHSTGYLGQSRLSGPVLARCYDLSVEFARLDQMFEVIETVPMTNGPTLESSILACEWISDCCVSILESNYQFKMLDTQAFLIVGHCDATRVQLVRWQFPSHPDYSTYENSLRQLKWTDEANANIYLLGFGELVKLGIQPWSVRVERLVRSSQWLEAMTLSLKYYRTVLQPLEYGTEFKTAGLTNALRDGSKIAELLKNYLQFHLDSLTADVGAVCIEYAVSINRLDLVFEDIFEAFVDKNKIDEFMSVFYPFVVSGKIDITIPPVIFDCLTQYVSSRESKETLEALFLALPTVPADLDGSIRMCKEKRLLSALCRLYNEGLNEFVNPVEVALNWMGVDSNHNKDAWNAFGYRVILYLSYCFLGMTFPKGTSALAPEVAQASRSSLIEYFFPNKGISLQAVHPPLFAMLAFDAGAFLKALEQAPGFNESFQIFQWLVVAGLDSKLEKKVRGSIIAYVLHHVAHIRRSNNDQEVTLETVLTSELSEKFFADVYMNAELNECVALVERFSSNPSWFLQQLVMLGEENELPENVVKKRRTLVAILCRIGLRAAPGEFAFADTLDAYLNLDDSSVVIEFVREQKSRLGEEPYFSRVVSSRAKRLLAMDPSASAKILFDMQVNVEELVRSLEGDPALQYALLEPLVGARAFGEEVTLYMVQTFVTLLCEREPDKAFSWLSKNEGRYPLDAALEACRKHNIDDATAYLLERAGRVEEALDLVLQKTSNMTPKKLEQSANAAIALCISFSQDKSRSDMWLRVLDAFLDLAHASNSTASNGNEEEKANETDQALSRIISRIVDAMMPYVNLSQLEEKVHQLESASGRFRPAINSMLESLRREAVICEVASKTLKQDQVLVEQRKRASRIRGIRVKTSAFLNSNLSVELVDDVRGPEVLAVRRPNPAPFVSGFDDYDILESCWDALGDAGPQRLAKNLLRGTVYEMHLHQPNVFEMQLPQMKDAGLPLFDQ